jgi:single-stranded-DNA-specific exonuclease
VEGLHITEAITENKGLLIGFGGHPMAAGLSLQKENLPAFRRGLGKAIEKQLGKIIREEPTLQIDAWLGLDEINLELAASLESLAPFGAGNPELVLATRDVTMKSVSTIGKAKEHLRLTVEDELGNIQPILWWSGAGEELPESGSKFDIAYSLRASTFHGEKQVAVQFEEFRVVEESLVEVRAKKVEVRDWRSETGNVTSLQPNVLVWAEGADRTKGKSRFELYPSEELAIYTTPPSPETLRSALEVVKPRKVYLIGISPAAEKADEFLSRLAGLTKFVINQRGGKVTLQELATVTGQRERAVRIGLEWLAAGAHLSISGEEDALLLSAENGMGNQYLQRELFVAVRGILDETAAYRAYFQRADVDALIG